MKNSHKQKRAALKQKRLARAQSLQARLAQAQGEQEARALITQAARQGVGVALADRAVLAAHHNATFLPGYYIDQPFICARCGTQQVWTAKQQKWWHEVAQGSLYSCAHHCHACRRERRQQRAQSRAGSPLEQQIQRLHALGQQRFQPELLQGEWHEALHSKWWGVRVAAIKTLGQWWGQSRAPEALALLKQLAESGGGDRKNWEHLAARAARKAIATHLQPADMQWAFDWLLRDQPLADMWSVVAAMPAAQVLHALNSPANLHAAHADAAHAKKLLHILTATNERSPGCAPAWARLARHYIASPVVGQQAQWLGWRLERLAALAAPGEHRPT